MNLNGMEVRYWLNCDCTSGQQVQAFLDWAGKLPQGTTVSQYISTSVVTRAQGTQTHYVSFRFISSITLQPGEFVEIQARFNKSDWSEMQQSNDWSYADNQSFAVQNRITGYVNSVLSWGTEPYAETGASALVASVVGFPNPSVSGGTTYLQYEITGAGTVSTQNSGDDRTLASIPDPDAKVMLDIFTSRGRLVWRTELTGVTNVSAGKHTVKWDGKSAAGHELAPGSYVLKVSVVSASGISSKNFVLLILK